MVEAESPLPTGLVEALARLDAYPSTATADPEIEHIQTHLSHVFLVGDRVYKLRKAVDLGFVRFATRAARNRDCLDELRLNRRLASDVYLGVSRVEAVDGGFRLSPPDPTPDALSAHHEHCVVMRRLPEGGDALSRLEAGTLTDVLLGRVAHKIARFHRDVRLGETSSQGAEVWLRGIEDAQAGILDAIDSVGPSIVPRPLAVALRKEMDSALCRLGPELEARRRAGRAVDGHGDLHLQHIWFDPRAESVGPKGEPVEPQIIDCLEFSVDLRRIDPAAEVAFTAMDLAYRGHSRLAENFVARYAVESDDYGLYRVVDYFIAQRAAVRAKVAALAAVDPEVDPDQRSDAAQSAQRHAAFARESLTKRGTGRVVLVGGVVGTGKSTVSRALAALVGGVWIASDRVRKAMRGLAPTERVAQGIDEGAYSREARSEVYGEMLQRAENVVTSGRTAILDATYSDPVDRDRARALADDLGVPIHFVETVCPDEVLRQRLKERRRRGDDASDAGPELIPLSRARFAALDEWPETDRIEVDTSRDDWVEQLGRTVPAMFDD